MEKKKLRKEIIVSRIFTIVIFLALIRCIAEVFRLHHYASKPLTFETIKPFLAGALIASVATLTIAILSFYAKYKGIIIVSMITIACLFLLKYAYAV